MKKFYASLAALAMIISSIILLNFANGVSNAKLPTDCDTNAIISCGATSASQLASAYKQNKKGDLDNIYHAYGLSDADVLNAGSRAKIGRVHKDGRITVGNETVATGARSLGRHYMSGSTKKRIDGNTYYERSTGVSFASESIVAFVYFDANGEFKTAIITSCGNPVTAKPKPKPVYTCNSLTATKITRTEYSLNASATAKNGATITGYTFDFGDGKKTTTTSKTATHTYAKEGTYVAKVTVTFKVGTSTKTVTEKKCQVAVPVTPPPVTPAYSCDSLSQHKISRTEYSFDGKATATNGAEIVNYTFDFGDGSQPQTVTSATGVTHTYAKEGTYPVKMTANIKVNGQTKAISGPQCETKVIVSPPPVTPTYTCDSLQVIKKTSRTEYIFSGSASAAGGAEIIGYTIDFGDGQQQAVTSAANIPHTYAKEGTYTVKLTAAVKVNGQTKTVTGPACETTVTVTLPNMVEVCNPATGETIVVDEKDQDKYKPVGDIACTPVKVCNPATGKIITVKPSEKDNYKPIGDKACQPAEECKPGVPMNDERCKPCDVPGKENYAKTDKECQETPAELPHTGTGSLIGGTLGLGSMIAAGAYWYASRRGLMSELLKR